MTLTVGSRIVGKAIDLDYKAQGVVKYEGYVIFVPRLIDDEIAEIEITKVKNSFCEAKIIKLIEKSKYRNDEESNLDALDLFHMTKEKQILWQEKITKDTFKKIAQIDVDTRKTITDQKDKGYRNKSVFHVLNDSVFKLGLYDHTKINLVDVDSFILSDETTNRILSFISQKRFNIQKNVLTHLVCRTNLKDEILITFVAKNDQIRGLDAIVDELQKIENVVGITLNINRNPKVILGKESKILYKGNIITERLNSIDFPINDRAFFQINVPVIEKAYQIIKEDLDENDCVLDAYSGIGSIGYYIYDKVKKVVMVESNKQNIVLANQIKERYNIDNVDVYHERAELYQPDTYIDKVICDPPRNGLMPEFIETIKKMNPKKIYYLSCDVKTLVRDIVLLKDSYHIESIDPIRMFYHTSSLETLVILNRI